MNGAATGEIALAERLLALLDRGAFTSTYKYAVVLALLDLCLEGADESSAPPTVLTTRQMAEKVIEIYWPQARPFEGDVLRQNRGGQAEILTRIADFQLALGRGASSWSTARRSSPDRARDLIDHVEWKLIQMPLPNLVLTDGRCNGNKRDHLPTVAHLARLRARNRLRAADLAEIAARHPDGFGPASAWNVAGAIYGRLPVGLELWAGYKDRFEAFEPAVWREAAA